MVLVAVVVVVVVEVEVHCLCEVCNAERVLLASKWKKRARQDDG